MEKKYGRYSLDIINGMIDWVRVIGSDHRIAFMNKAMKDQVGDFTGMKCYQGLGLESPCPNCITDETLETGKIHMKEETVRGRVYSVASSPIRDEEGRVCSAVEVFRDITKEKMLEQRTREQNKKLNNNLCFAKTLQQRMLPPKGIVDGCLLVDYSYAPCEMLGGDLFDVFPAGGGGTAVYIFDIAGHGVMSSMMTMFVRQTVRALAEEGRCPSLVLKGLLENHVKLGLDDESFITILYGVYNPGDSTFVYANGGHNPPLLLRDGNVQTKEGAAPPICSLALGYEYDEYTVKLQKGDYLYLYTDGITEARSTNREFFGVDGLAGVLEGGKGVKGVMEAVQSFSGGVLVDDIALLEIKII
ncbi:MAG: SpoIIE family protein phosphatase [Clostridia bacterium]|jgi:sigma-B regulation protein RsbU (phosphoserine phosphatase)|nr:SpoIIE family protein phosphatase [Clostridiales bacterium]